MISLNTHTSSLLTAQSAIAESSTQATNSNSGLTASQAQSLAQNIATIDPATLFTAGANRQTGYVEALALID